MKIHLTVAGCAVKKKCVLLIFHRKYKKWLFPGGHIEKNETPDVALIREFTEETGLRFVFPNFKEPIRYIEPVYELPIPFYINIHKVNDHYHYCSYFKGVVLDGDIAINYEVKQLKWFSKNEIMRETDIPDHIKSISLKALKTSYERNK
jgi:8-oxo-dGTP pyrophosphatase MutT (NUDIX family)